MGVETASYISQLVDTNPVVGDPVGEGDDHLRLIKTVLQTQFPNLTAGAVNTTQTEMNLLDGVTALVSLAVANEWTKTQNFDSTSLTYDATQDWDLSVNQVCDLTLTDNTIFDAPTNQVDGGFYSITIIQDGSGSRTASWNAVFKWAAGTAPTLTTAASAKDIFVFRSDGTNMLEVGRQLNVS